MKSSEIRQAFIHYFAQHGHQVVDSSSLVPANDPTLLFTNAGMVQFKETFLGLETRSYNRAVSSQRCVRAGGKHNDLENVGYTARHHTFFEMLGNFSFGDYFKREAINYAWGFLTNVLKLPPERLWVTVFTDDEEAADIWLKELKVSPERFSRCGEKDNFWSMGDTGPCGPCTEIFYDHGADIPGGPPGSPEEDGDRYIEIWNLVFMQYNRDKEGRLHPLPKPSVDTGMGLERIAAVVQGVHSNYHIDSFQHLIKAIAQMGGVADMEHPSLKVVADHIRACSFLITDGVMPSNEGRGYVLRRIIRRAVRHGHKLGLPSSFFHQLVPSLIEVMGEAYPELSAQQALIERVLKQEEEQFARTLQQGLNLLQEAMTSLSQGELAGDVAFKLYDTYGFPVDLTADIVREQGLQIDMEGFNQCMQRQRALSQSASQFEADYSSPIALTHSSEFKGYEQDTLTSEVVALIIDGNEVEQLNAGDKAGIVLKNTPFYPESGGQVGDQGYLLAEGTVFQVDDTKKTGSAIIHYGQLQTGLLKPLQTVTAQVDSVRRDAIRLNHTATHLLHAALKLLIGEHVQQKGSLVEDARARFDFSHFEALTADEIDQLETLVNDKIRDNTAVVTQIMSIDEAKQSGAVALFGEKYAKEVRVLSIDKFSKELCGGTHAKRTGDIGLFKIIAEYGIASGVRRIEMITGGYALEWVNQKLSALNDLAAKLKTSPDEAVDKLMQLMQEAKQQEKEITRLQTKLASQSGQSILSEVVKIGQVNVLIKRLEEVDNQALRSTLDQLKSTLEKAVIVLYTQEHDKLQVVAGITKDILGKVPNAKEYVRLLCGKGGGRDDMAQGGGMAPSNIQEKIKALQEMIAESAFNSIE